MKIIKESLKENIKAGSVPDKTMPIMVPKNNAKIFKSMQKSVGLKSFNKGAQIDEATDRGKEFYDRFEGLSNISDFENFITSVKKLTIEAEKEGFDREDILDALDYFMSKTVNTFTIINNKRKK